jgi:hypothetical protein
VFLEKNPPTVERWFETELNPLVMNPAELASVPVQELTCPPEWKSGSTNSKPDVIARKTRRTPSVRLMRLNPPQAHSARPATAIICGRMRRDCRGQRAGMPATARGRVGPNSERSVTAARRAVRMPRRIERDSGSQLGRACDHATGANFAALRSRASRAAQISISVPDSLSMQARAS